MKKTIYKIELKMKALKNNINANISKLKRDRGLISKNFGNKVFNNLANEAPRPRGYEVSS